MNDLPKNFEPLLPAEPVQPSEKLIADLMRVNGDTREQTLSALAIEAAATKLYLSSQYQVQVRRLSEDLVQLNIRRPDGKAILRDWRHFQAIKNQLCGDEATGIEVYPAESKKTDTCNKYHMFVWLKPGAVGVEDFFGGKRDVIYSTGQTNGTRQRPL